MQKPSWIRVAPYVDPPAPEPPPPPSVAAPPPPSSPRRPSVAPPSMRPSMAPPPSRRGTPIIQSTREVELEAEIGALQTELARVTNEAEHMRARVMEESEPAVVALAVAIARRVVGRELATDPGLIQFWIKEALGTLPTGAVYVAADVAPGDGQSVDPSLPAGSAEVRDGASTVTASADARVAALADALGVDS